MAVNITIPKFNLRELASKIKQLGSAAFRNVGTQDNDLATIQYVNQGRKNLIINGDMRIAQRGVSFSTSGYNLDRFAQDPGRNNTVERTTDAPSGFTYSHKTSGGSQHRNTWTNVELDATGEAGVFKVGQTFTLSFYAKDTLSQNTTLDIRFADTGLAFTNSVAVASTSLKLSTEWVRHTFTFTVNATPVGTNKALVICQAVSNTSDTIWITGVQLEQGSIATPFEYRPIGEELALCRDYYRKYTIVNAGDRFCSGYINSTIQSVFTFQFDPMRATPTATLSGTASDYSVAAATGVYAGTGASISSSPISANITITTAGGMTVGQACALRAASSSAYIALSAEL